MKDYFFVSECDGGLYDTRITDWHKKPARENYRRTYREINTTKELLATIRNGEYAWPGGYQMAFITSDGALLCFDCVKKELRSVIWSIRNKVSDGWRVTGCDIFYDGEQEEWCDHCGKCIAEAPGE